ncbi:hypothetical protein C2W64_00213 [Brevibacillus laterosporus]|nr:hypothetical protein C2W64_00213 [Brevibacillus laterosporus]
MFWDDIGCFAKNLLARILKETPNKNRKRLISKSVEDVKPNKETWNTYAYVKDFTELDT